jgi:hypothetical protein
MVPYFFKIRQRYLSDSLTKDPEPFPQSFSKG